MKVPLAAFLFLSLVTSACVTDPSVCPEFQQGRRPIINGQLDTSAAHDAVIMLYHNSGVMCSGTLVSQRVILTAAHCVHNMDRTGFTVFFGTNVNDQNNGEWVGVSDVWEHPGYSLNQTDVSQPTTLNDIAMVRLNRDAPSGVQPIPYLPQGYALSQADVGTQITFVGFGKDEAGQVGRKLFIVGSLGLACDGPSNCYYDGVPIGPHYIAFDERSGGPCSGDSGGPALVVRNGQEYVAGVASYVDQNCQYFGASTKVDAYQTEIEDFIGNTHPEDCTNGTDDDGDGLTDCADPECGSSPYCSGPTACQQPAVLSCGQTVTASTQGASQRFMTYPCISGSEMGPELAFQLSIPIGTHVQVTVTPGSSQDFDLVVLPAVAATCDHNRCVAQSAQTGTDPESLTFETPSGGSYLLVDSKDASAGTFHVQVHCGSNLEICDNNQDDDGDGLTDCADSDCSNAPACSQPNQEICNNNQDDDGDGLTDCADSDCSGRPECTGGETCDNNQDDDGDGLIDCADPDCAAACKPSADGPRHIVGSCSTAGKGASPWLWLLPWIVILWRKSRRHS